MALVDGVESNICSCGAVLFRREFHTLGVIWHAERKCHRFRTYSENARFIPVTSILRSVIYKMVTDDMALVAP